MINDNSDINNNPNIEHVTDFRAWVKENLGEDIDADYLLEKFTEQAVTIIPKPLGDYRSVSDHPESGGVGPDNAAVVDSDEILIVEMQHKRVHHYVDWELYNEYKAKEAILPPDHPGGAPTVSIFYHCNAEPRLPLTGLATCRT